MTKKIKRKNKLNLKTVNVGADIPATHGQLYAVRSELKSDIASLSLKVDSSFKAQDAKIEKILSAVHNIQALVEEQNSRNKFVFDGLKSVIDVQTDLFARVDKLEKVTFGTGS